MEACWICASIGDGEITLETINHWSGRLSAILDASQGYVCVPVEMVEKAMDGWCEYYGNANDANVVGNNRDAMRAALERVASKETNHE